MVVTSGNGYWGAWLGKGRGHQGYSDRILDQRWWHTVQYTGDVSLNCTLETYIISLTNDTPINLIKSLKNKMKEMYFKLPIIKSCKSDQQHLADGKR